MMEFSLAKSTSSPSDIPASSSYESSGFTSTSFSRNAAIPFDTPYVEEISSASAILLLFNIGFMTTASFCSAASALLISSVITVRICSAFAASSFSTDMRI